MNYQSMGPSASSFAQFYHQAAASAVSAASAGVVGVGVDSLGKYLSKKYLFFIPFFKIVSDTIKLIADLSFNNYL